MKARQQLTATGTCAFLLETSDDFINVEGTSLYRLDDLQNRIVHINEVLETAGGLRRRTRFAGLVENATFQPSGQRSVIQVTAVDVFGLMAQDTAVFGQEPSCSDHWRQNKASAGYWLVGNLMEQAPEVITLS